MAKPRRTAADPAKPAPANKRGSPEAVQKRRLARKLNKLLTEGADPAAARDGRTERRRQRLLQELEEGTRTQPPTLKPIEILQHAHDLLEMGEGIASLRKVVKVAPRTDLSLDDVKSLLTELQKSYNFRPEVYEFLGFAPETLATLGLGENPAPPATPRRSRPSRTP
jgi:hypothetical protein